MTTIDEIIQRESNPFDEVTFKTGNFWKEDPQTKETVNSIHQEAIDQITQVLKQTAKDHCTRTVMLMGDAGSGKSYVLKRLKQSLNSKAFFVYVPPFVDNDYIWRHTLRQTVDSLMHKPEGQAESQLMLWLKSLSLFKDQVLLKKLLGERSLFIKNLKAAFPVGIYQPQIFFGVLYDLSNPDLYAIACSWLRGDDLDEDELNALKIKKSIDNETAAQGILANFGRISLSTYPIVLCFDQVESKQLPDGSADIQPVFNVNTFFHNEKINNFLIIISININTWKQNNHRIQQSDKDRSEKTIILKPISLDQAEALWAMRLHFLHIQALPQPKSKIFPFSRQLLEEKFEGGKTTPRRALVFGSELFLAYKLRGTSVAGDDPPIPPYDPLATFKLLWQDEFSQTQKMVKQIRHFSDSELISMLTRVLSALQVKSIQARFLPSPTYASHSCLYQEPHQNSKLGIVWTEGSANSFVYIMKACDKVASNQSYFLYLIRAEKLGRSSSRGYQIYEKVFGSGSKHKHITPDLLSVQYLATYDRLVNSAHAQELLLAGKEINLSQLESLVRDSNLFENCQLLQVLRIFQSNQPEPYKPSETSKGQGKTTVKLKPNTGIQKEKDFVLSLVKTQFLVARTIVANHTFQHFPNLNDAQLTQVIQQLCQERQIKILDETAPPNAQIICIIPQK